MSGGLHALRRWWRERLAVRLVTAVFGLAMTAAALLGYLRYLDEERQLARMVDQIGVSLRASAALALPDWIISEDLGALQEYTRDLLAQGRPGQEGVPVAFARVERLDGKVLATAGIAPDSAAAADLRLVTAPALLRPEGKELGRTSIGIDLRRWRHDLRDRAVSLFLQNLLAAASIAVVLLLLLQRMVGRPLRLLGEQAARIGGGNLEQPVAITATDEFGRLATTLEQMRANLRTSHASLHEQNQRLVELDLLKDQFLANMSHEIRTPLQSILGNIGLLGGADAALQPECLASIERNAGHLLCLVNQVLDFSKLQTGNLSIERGDVDLRPLLDDVAGCLRAQVVAKGLELRVDVAAAAPVTLHTDALRLRQILLNLVGNAVKFTDRGLVLVQAAPAADGRLAITVQDTGIGIPAARLPRLFRAFSLGDASATRRHGGSGLGLVISRALARLLGGDVTITSSDGVGTTALLTLDPGRPTAPSTVTAAATPAAPRPVDPAVPAPYGRLDGSVLLVDDAVENRRLFATVLRKSGLNVITADNGEQALTAFAAAQHDGKPFDLVVMDIQMPVLDGCSACQRLRADGCTQPLIALTAHATAQDRDRCLAAGFDAYATKPIGPRALLELVRAHLRPVG